MSESSVVVIFIGACSIRKVCTGPVSDTLSIKRSKSAYFDSSDDVKAVGASTATTDNLAILAWSDNYVRRAEGAIKMYADLDNPLYLGSIFNGSVRAGGTIGRNDEKGVYALIQST